MTVKTAPPRSPHHRPLRSERPLPPPVGPLIVRGVARIFDAPDGSLTMIVAIEPDVDDVRDANSSLAKRRVSTTARLRAMGGQAGVLAVVVPGEARDLPLVPALPFESDRGLRQPQPDVLSEAAALQCGDVEVDCEARVVRISGERMLLPFAEFELLLRFVRNLGKALTREDLMGASDGHVSPRIVDVRVARLRHRLAHARGFVIETVTRVGYRCVEATPA